MAVTEHREYPLPDETRDLDDEIRLLQTTTLPMIDLDMKSLFDALGGKAADDHEHSIADISGLQTALDGKLSSNHTFTLASLSDVLGVAEAPDGYVLVKVGNQMVAQSGAAALGNHNHSIGQVTNLQTALDGKSAKSANLSDLANPLTARQNLKIWTGTQAQYDAIGTKNADTLYFIA